MYTKLDALDLVVWMLSLDVLVRPLGDQMDKYQICD